MTKQLNYLRNTHIREIGGSVLYIKDNNDCLTIHRNWLSQPSVEDMEGEWNRMEIMEAINDYENHDASKR